VLLQKLTAYDNLDFFAKFKGIEDDKIPGLIKEKLDLFNLSHKSGTAVSDLSGGQKRKLQLAISLMGNAQFVLLDEPTSGMDPTARRETWEIIKKSKKGRLIILTTHYMDEAEYLADRVAIMSSGQLKCCGSSLFLKNKYGTGFILTIEKHDNFQDLSDFDKLLRELCEDNS
jgi:ATP-binding cassette subfamily A (ABC1) protein 3